MPIMTVPDAVALAARKLSDAGFETVVVGGAVRDSLLGRPAKDWDLGTAATPKDVLRIFPYASVTTRFGTTLVPSPAGLLEITTYRSEADYADYRRPSTIAFTTDLSQDLARRDFTINAMAYDPVTDRLIDPFGGAADLAARRLRAVGVAEDRFGEDALRLLRAIRFIATLNLTFDQATGEAARRQAHLTKHLAVERTGTEFIRLIAAPHVDRALTEASRVGLLDAFLPNLSAPHGALRHGALALSAVGPRAEIVERVAALTHHARATPAESAQAVYKALSALALGEDWAREVAHVIAATGLAPELRGPELAKAMLPWRIEHINASLRVRVACERAVSGNKPRAIEGLETEIARIFALGLPRTIGDLAINGQDLIALGLPPGPRFKAILYSLLMATIEGRVTNDRAALTKLVGEITTGPGAI